MTKLYNTVSNGFVARQQLPNRLLGGFHHSELYVFNQRTVEYIEPVDRTILGGGVQSDTLIAIDVHTPTFDKVVEKINKYLEKTKINTFDETRKNNIIVHSTTAPTLIALDINNPILDKVMLDAGKYAKRLEETNIIENQRNIKEYNDIFNHGTPVQSTGIKNNKNNNRTRKRNKG